MWRKTWEWDREGVCEIEHCVIYIFYTLSNMSAKTLLGGENWVGVVHGVSETRTIPWKYSVLV